MKEFYAIKYTPKKTSEKMYGEKNEAMYLASGGTLARNINYAHKFNSIWEVFKYIKTYKLNASAESFNFIKGKMVSKPKYTYFVYWHSKNLPNYENYLECNTLHEAFNCATSVPKSEFLRIKKTTDFEQHIKWESPEFNEPKVKEGKFSFYTGNQYSEKDSSVRPFYSPFF